MKKFLSVMLIAVMLVSMVGCVTKNTDTSDSAIKADKYQKSLETNAKVYRKFVKFSDYNGLEVEVDKTVLEITDEDVQKHIDDALTSFSETKEIKEGTVKKGDVVRMDYAGKLNGVAFSGGTATDTEYTVGSLKFIEDLDKGLVGLTIGKETDIPCTFPSNYGTAELAGKDVIFTVTVTAVLETVKPELTDEWVKANADKLGTQETTVAGLKTAVKDYLIASAELDYASAKFVASVQKVMDTAEVKGYPQKELDALKATFKTNTEAEYEQMKTYYQYFGIEDFDGYIKSYYNCNSDEDFDKYAEQQAKDYLLEKMIITIIAVDNKVEVSADDIKKLGEDYASGSDESAGYDTLIEEYGEIVNAELGYSIVCDKVMSIVNGAVSEVQVEKESESATESSSAPAASEAQSESASK